MAFDPSEQRDEKGKWTAGGSHASGPAMFVHDRVNEPSAERVATKAAEVARRLAYDPSLINVSDESRTFELNGKTHNYAGSAMLIGPGKPGEPQSTTTVGTITLYTPHISESSIPSVTAHEIEHQKYQAFIEDAVREGGLLQHDPDYNKNGEMTSRPDINGGAPSFDRTKAFMRADGTLNEPYASKYPTYQAYTKAMNDFDRMAKEDGCTAYSREYWVGYAKGTVSKELAYHETLCEMSALRGGGEENRAAMRTTLDRLRGELKQMEARGAVENDSDHREMRKAIYGYEVRLGVKGAKLPENGYIKFLQGKLDRMQAHFPDAADIKDAQKKIAETQKKEAEWVKSLKQDRLTGPGELGRGGKVSNVVESKAWNELYKAVDSNWKQTTSFRKKRA